LRRVQHRLDRFSPFKRQQEEFSARDAPATIPKNYLNLALHHARRFIDASPAVSLLITSSPFNNMTPKLHTLTIADRRQESQDTISLSFKVPTELVDAYQFTQGQYLTLKANIDGTDVRRSYSICVAVSDYTRFNDLRVAIKRVDGGVFSNFAHDQLQRGDPIEVMTPEGRFFTLLSASAAKHYVAFAAGSGITPILSLMKTTLESEPLSRFTLVYGNRKTQSIMFLEEIEALKNQYLSRVRLIHILSAQPQEVALFNGRIDRSKTKALVESLIPAETIDQVFICGPASMIDEVETALLEAHVTKDRIHAERFGVPKAAERRPTQPSTATGKNATLRIQLDGTIRTMPFAFGGPALLDVALNNGLDLPYACKGGVCCTCRAKVLEGEVRMEKNYTLEKWEVEKGFVLTCQCHPISDSILVSFDER
jgi:ring-1,2-phenylacetyl-CoA epoxidase subunit PaaE